MLFLKKISFFNDYPIKIYRIRIILGLFLKMDVRYPPKETFSNIIRERFLTNMLRHKKNKLPIILVIAHYIRHSISKT